MTRNVAHLYLDSASIKALRDSPYFEYMNTPGSPGVPAKTPAAEIYWTLVDPPIEGDRDDNSKSRANSQKIHVEH